MRVGERQEGKQPEFANHEFGCQSEREKVGGRVERTEKESATDRPPLGVLGVPFRLGSCLNQRDRGCTQYAA
jgi:hypothetical protein